MAPKTHTQQKGRVQERGFSLVELMVGMLIALIGTIIIFQVFSVSEGLKRTTTGVSDAQQTGSFSTYTLERYLRLGGAGLARVTNIWGCALNTWNGTSGTFVRTVPPATSYPTAFSAVPTGLRITPILIANGGGATATDPTPDTVVVMGGQHSSVNVPLRSAMAPGASSPPDKSVQLVNPVGIQPGDLLLAVDQDPASPVFQTCRVVQAVGSVVAPTLPDKYGVVPNPVSFDGGAFTPTTPNALNQYSGTIQLADLGGAPAFTAFALGTGVAPDSLLSYDLISGNAPTSIADNIVNMQATYGVVADFGAPISAANPLIWKTPTGTGATGWSAATLMDGSDTSRDNIARIRAVRIAIVARSAQYEKDNVTAANWKLFGDLPSSAQMDALPSSITSTATWRQYRYRTYEVTVPLRNMLLPLS